MAEDDKVVAFEKKAYLVARGTTEASWYLRQVNTRYEWTKSAKDALHFTVKEKAEALAARVAGDAKVAEVVVV